MTWSIPSVLLTILLIFILSQIIGILKNIRLARQIGLPYVITPISSTHILYLLTYDFLRPWINKYGNDGLKASHMNWIADQRYYLQEKYGWGRCVVSPTDTKISVASPAAVKRCFAGKGVVKPKEFYFLFELFGPNVASTEGDEWSRHKRITAPPFNERNNELVWNCSLAAADTLVASHTSSSSITTPSPRAIFKDMKSLSLNVFELAGFGSQDTKAIGPGCKYPFRESVSMVLDKLFTAVALPHAIRPPYLQRVIADLQRYLLLGVADEKKKLVEAGGADEGRNTLMAALVRESERERSSQKGTTGGKVDRLLPLTDTEIYGNMFIYYVAGHETTRRH